MKDPPPELIDTFLSKCVEEQSIEINAVYRAGFRAKGERGSLLPGIIVDRDGVIVEEVNYLSRPEDVRIMPGAIDLLNWAHRYGLPVGMATNQAGIDRGYFSWSDYRRVTDRMNALLMARDARINAVVGCPFHPSHTVDYSEHHEYWRKPGPGMIHILSQHLSLDLARSWMIGDNVTDVGAAKAAGMKGAIHVLTGHGRRYREDALALNAPSFVVVTCDDLEAALTYLKECDWKI